MPVRQSPQFIASFSLSRDFDPEFTLTRDIQAKDTPPLKSD